MSRVSTDFLGVFEEELGFLRQSGAQFAEDHPALAAGMGPNQAEDPSVERLLEGVAFLSARVGLKLVTSERQVARELLHAMVPILVQPVPSTAVLSLDAEDNLNQISAPIEVTRGTNLRMGAPSIGGHCQFRTTQDLTVYPWRLENVRYLGSAAMAPLHASLSDRMKTAKAAMVLTFQVGKQAQATGFSLTDLSLHVGGDSAAASSRVLRAMLCDGMGVVAVAQGQALGCAQETPLFEVPGFDEDERLFDRGHAQYAGHRVLAEWFAMPERFQFVRCRFSGATEVRVQGVTQVQICILLNTDRPALADDLARVEWNASAVPVVNEYTARLDRVLWNPAQTECHLVVDRLQPQAQEILDVHEVSVYPKGGVAIPARSILDPTLDAAAAPFAYHVLRRMRAPWRLGTSAKATERRDEPATSVHLSLVAPSAPEQVVLVDQVAVTALVCDGDRPQKLWRTSGVRWTVETSGGLKVKVLTPPSACTRRHLLEIDTWALVSSLRQSLETFIQAGSATLACRLRELVSRFVLDGSARSQRMIESIRSAVARTAVRAVPGGGPLAYCRGVVVEIETHVEDVDTAQMFMFSLVLDRFLAGHCSINGFTQLGVRTPLSETSWQWPARRGMTELL